MMTESVFQYALNNNIEGITEEYCYKLVLGSHQNTATFQSLSDNQQTEYSIVAVDEEQGNINAKGLNCED